MSYRRNIYNNNRYNRYNRPNTNKYFNHNSEFKRLKEKYGHISVQEVKNWDNVHKKAKLAIDEKGREEFVDWMNYLKISFGCGKCRKHISEYLFSHPIPQLDDNDDKAIFRWAWEFHNAVNARLGKPIFSWEDTVKRY